MFSCSSDLAFAFCFQFFFFANNVKKLGCVLYMGAHNTRVNKVSKNVRDRRNIWHDRDSNPKPTARERCCPNPTAVIYF